MKKYVVVGLLGLFIGTATISCREQSEEDKLIKEMKDEGAEIDVSDDGNKIKMETDDKSVKIKRDDGDTKIKVKTDNDDN